MGTPINLTLEQKLPDGAWEDLQTRYSEPHRYYHTWGHIENMLETFEEIKYNLDNRVAVEMAILYHDVIYDPNSFDNEERSADLSMELLSPMYIYNVREIVETLILHTKEHKIHEESYVAGGDLGYFLDMDLASLGVSEEQFDINGKNIRKEYAHLTDEQYNAGRLSFFDSFLARDRIYFTDYFYDKFEVKARDNLTRSKKALEEKNNGK